MKSWEQFGTAGYYWDLFAIIVWNRWEVLGAVWKCWVLLVTIGKWWDCWELLGSVHCWELLRTARNCRELLLFGIVGNCWEVLGIVGKGWELLGTVGKCRELL